MLSSSWNAQPHESQMRVNSRKPETSLRWSQILPKQVARFMVLLMLLKSPLPLMTAPLTYLSCLSLSILFTTSSP